MKARDVMTADAVSVHPEATTREVAEILLHRAISALPVVDESGAVVGIVSEGDLVGRPEADREARRDWWLALLAEGEPLSAEFLAGLRRVDRRVRDVMSTPVVSVGADTEVEEIARLLVAYRIKRVPVVDGGRLVGIVSRADLLRAVTAQDKAVDAPAHHGVLADAIGSLDRHFLHRPRPEAEPPDARERPDEARLGAADFRKLVADFEQREAMHRDEDRRAAAERRRQRVSELVREHVSDAGWQNLLHQARQVAEHGGKEFLLLRFPAQLCSDGGRAINVSDARWPATLCGEAAEMYLRWEHALKPSGFHLAARILEFPGGMPGDAGLFLAWGQ
jgi:CBS domain-containing protein